MGEQWVEKAHKQWKDEEGRRLALVATLNASKQKVKDLTAKLTEATRDKQSAKGALLGAKWQAEDQRLHLRRKKEQLSIAKDQIEVLKKKLASAEEVTKQAEHVDTT